jgi:uncharacterized protein
MSASLGLYRLQQVDTKIDRTRSQLDTIRKTLENNAELNDTLARVEEARTEFLRAKQELKNIEAETESQKLKIEQTESSLYSGKVQNPKELQDLQKEAASLKKYLGTLEERELESMLNTENKESSFNDEKSRLDQIQSRLGSEHKTLLEEQSRLRKDLDRLGEEREASVNPIDQVLLVIYEDLRKQKRGVAVSDFGDSTCASCGSSLNASLQQNARSSKQLAYCPSCGRILYAS